MRRLLFLAAAVLLAAFAACDGEQRYVYSAQRYDPVLGCLDVNRPVETVPGDGVSLRCPITCLTVGANTYLSTLCPPVPDIATETDAQTPECQAALDASRLEAGCASDEQAEEPDAGGEIDGGEGDGGEDAGGEDAATGDDGATDSGSIKDAGDAG